MKPIYLTIFILAALVFVNTPALRAQELTTPRTSAEREKNRERERRRREADPLSRRVASILLSETFINEQLQRHLEKSELLRELKVDLEAESDKMLLRGIFQIPIDDYRAMGIDPSAAQFRFQLTVKPRVGRKGSLILEFPLTETFFYQANSKNPERDRVIIPVQLLSLGLASARGYLSALSGDFSSFDRKSAKYAALLKGVKRSIKEETNPDALAVLKNEKRALELQLESTDLQRDQFQITSKTLNNILGGADGENDFNLSNDIKARRNSIILKMRLGQLVPYLKDVDLGGIRMNHNKRDGAGEDYFVIDVDTKFAEVQAPVERKPRTPRAGLKVAPSIQIRMNQDIFNSKTVMDAQKEKMGPSIKDFDVTFEEDGIHVSGKAKKWFLNIPFDSTVDFVSTGADVFEVRLKELSVWGLNLKFLTKIALDAVKGKLDSVLKGMCTYEYAGDWQGSKVLRVRVDPKTLIPAFPDLHLVDVDVRDRSFTMRIGRTEQEIKP